LFLYHASMFTMGMLRDKQLIYKCGAIKAHAPHMRYRDLHPPMSDFRMRLDVERISARYLYLINGSTISTSTPSRIPRVKRPPLATTTAASTLRQRSQTGPTPGSHSSERPCRVFTISTGVDDGPRIWSGQGRQSVTEEPICALTGDAVRLFCGTCGAIASAPRKAGSNKPETAGIARDAAGHSGRPCGAGRGKPCTRPPERPGSRQR
jgi:hypothetical protein